MRRTAAVGRSVLACVFALAALAGVRATGAGAATFDVCGYDAVVSGSGSCTSLPAAVAQALASNENDTIRMAPGRYCPLVVDGGSGTIDFVGEGFAGLPAAPSPDVLGGAEAALTAFQWNPAFCPAPDQDATLVVSERTARTTFRNLAFLGPTDPTDLRNPTRGIVATDAAVALRDVLVSGFRAQGVQASPGANADFEMDESALLGNGTGLQLSGEGSLVHSTVANNGIGVDASGNTHLLNDTITANGIGVNAPRTSGDTMQVVSTIVLGNTTDCSQPQAWELAFSTNNLLGGCPRLDTDFAAAESSLAAPAQNGGPTPSIPPPDDAVARGASGCGPVDQRESLIQAGSCDIGAVQADANSTQAVSVSPDPLDFGRIPVAAHLSVGVSTIRGGQVGISHVAVAGSGFVLGFDGCTHAVLVTSTPGGPGSPSCALTLVAAGTGPISGTLTIDGTFGERVMPISATAVPSALTVTRFDDPTGDGSCPTDCSLRQAVAAVPPGGTVTLPAGTYTLDQGALAIDKTIDLDGAGADTTIVRQSARSRVVWIEPTGAATIVGLTITGGHTIAGGSEPNSGVGGGVWNQNGGLTLRRVVVRDNHADVSGGGVDNNGSTTIEQSVIENNTASGGNLEIGGGVDSWGDSLRISNTTIAGNRAGTNGGGVLTGTGTTTLSNDTIVDNHAGVDAGGVSSQDPGVTNLENTIVALNVAETSEEHNNCRGVASRGHNLSSDGTCSLDTSLGDLPDTTPVFLSGTFTPAPASPELDAGDDESCEAVDQLGTPRPQGAHCDIGAIEATPAAAPSAAFLSATAGLSVSLDGTASTGAGLAYAWQFGDGATAAGETTTHTYQRGGLYTITLTVTAADGATDSVSHDVTVTAPSEPPTPSPTTTASPAAPPPAPPAPAPPPVSLPSATPPPISIVPPVVVANVPPVAVAAHSVRGLVVRFDGRESFDVDGRIVSYRWTFGDGSRGASSATTSHRYTKAGTYTATLKVADDAGAPSTVKIKVAVRPAIVSIDVGEAFVLGTSYVAAAPVSIDVAEPVTAGGTQTIVPPASVGATEGAVLGDTSAVVPPASVGASESIGAGGASVVTPAASIDDHEGLAVGDGGTPTKTPKLTLNSRKGGHR